MIRNLKALGLALIAVFALGAMAASAASANEFTAESYSATLTGVSDGSSEVLETTSGSVTCSSAVYHGELAAASTTLTIRPTYGHCTAFGILPTLIDLNGCHFLFHVIAFSSTGTTDIVCPAGQEITVTVNENTANTLTTKCTVHIPPQTGINNITYTNSGTGTTREITVDLNATNITYKHTPGTGLGACIGGHSATGKFTGKEVFTGLKTGAHVGTFLS